jgi:prepilin-type N-terminal cleavage/methylation domain-containing protein
MMKIPHRRLHRSGLTLMELMVVLVILAVTLLLAIEATDHIVDQARFEVSQRGLEQIQNAVLGNNESESGRGSVGFVADTGRLPLAWGTDRNTQLAELWSNPRNLPAFGLATAPSDPEVKLLAGWRGPYLRLPPQPPGPQRLLDGWGNPYLLFQVDGVTPIGADQPIVFVTSAGGPAAPYNTPLALTTPFLLANWTGTVTGSIVDSDPNTPATGDVIVKLFLPDVSHPSGIRELSVTATATSGYAFTFPAAVGAVPHVTIGPKVLRAYHTYTNAGGQQVTVKSALFHLRIPPGGLTRTITMDLH